MSEEAAVKRLDACFVACMRCYVGDVSVPPEYPRVHEVVMCACRSCHLRSMAMHTMVSDTFCSRWKSLSCRAAAGDA